MKRSSKVVSIVLALPALLVAGAAPAQTRPDVTFLSSRLKAEDFRVRTNAALALGAVASEEATRAVQPLCDSLGDASEVVRQASAVALKRLARPAALPCLRARLVPEQTDVVKLQISRAIEAIEASGNSDGPPPTAEPKENPNAKFYVTFSIANASGRSDIDGVMTRPIRQKLEGAGTFQLAPAKESSEGAKAVLSKRKLKGYYLAVAIDKLEYTEDGSRGLVLKVKVKAAIFSYPGKDLKGEIGPKSASVGVSRRGDTAAEDNIVNAVTAALFDQVTQNLGLFP